MTGRDWKEHQCLDRATAWEAILSSQGSLNESESRALAEVREFIDHAKAPTDTFELLVADLLPNDDDGGEEPGAMCRRALARAAAQVDLIRQVATMICRPGELERLETDEASRHNVLACAREIIELVRATPAPDTIILTRDRLTTALREAAAQGMDRTSGPSCEEAASCRDVADDIVEAIDAGRFSPDTYVYAFMEEQKAIQRARQGVGS